MADLRKASTASYRYGHIITIEGLLCIYLPLLCVDFPYDTPASVVMKVTWVPSDISKFADFPPYFHIPAPTSQQRISLEQKKLAERARAIQDAYIRGNADPSAPMEQYLARELSNPHSRARKQKRWQEARAESDRLRVKFMRAAKEARQTGG